MKTRYKFGIGLAVVLGGVLALSNAAQGRYGPAITTALFFGGLATITALAARERPTKRRA